MWEHLNNLQLLEEWIYVYFNYPTHEVRVQRTLTRLEEELTRRRQQASVEVDAVLPGWEHNT
jgi:hypothetical protein